MELNPPSTGSHMDNTAPAVRNRDGGVTITLLGVMDSADLGGFGPLGHELAQELVQG